MIPLLQTKTADTGDSLCSPILRSGTCSVHYVMQRLSVVETQSQKGNVIFEVETGGLWLPVVHM